MRARIYLVITCAVAACKPSPLPTASGVALSLCDIASSPQATGVAYTLVATVTVGGDAVPDAGECGSAGSDAIAGATVTFATNATGVTFSPASNATGLDGRASAVVVVPYGTELIASASAPDGGLAYQPLSAAGMVCLTASIGSGSDVEVGSSGGTGMLYPVFVGVHVGSSGLPVVGTSVSFNQIGVSTSSNGFSPATEVTNEAGSATSFAYVVDLAGGSATILYADIAAAGEILEVSRASGSGSAQSGECGSGS